jgi:glycerophosphoryl diester phosphodiesterase
MGLFASGFTLIGHRGLRRSGMRIRENTPESYRFVHRMGGTWVELDARQAADGVIVVWHDETVPGGRPAGSVGSDEIRRYGGWTLEHILDLLPPSIGIDLDVKNRLSDASSPPEETTAARVARITAKVMDERPVLLTSFDPALRKLVATTSAELPTGLLTWPEVPLRESIPAARHLGYAVVAPHVDALKPHGIPLGASQEEIREQIDIAHQVGLEVLVWVAEPRDLRYLRDVGVDAACVDDVEASQAALKG